MKTEFYGDAQIDVVMLDDGELQPGILEQFPVAIYENSAPVVEPYPGTTYRLPCTQHPSQPIEVQHPANQNDIPDVMADIKVAVIIIAGTAFLAWLIWFGSV